MLISLVDSQQNPLIHHKLYIIKILQLLSLSITCKRLRFFSISSYIIFLTFMHHIRFSYLRRYFSFDCQRYSISPMTAKDSLTAHIAEIPIEDDWLSQTFGFKKPKDKGL